MDLLILPRSADLARKAEEAIVHRTGVRRPGWLDSVGQLRLHENDCQRRYVVPCSDSHESAWRTAVGVLTIVCLPGVLIWGWFGAWPPVLQFVTLLVPLVWFFFLNPHLRALAAWKTHGPLLQSREIESGVIVAYLGQFGRDLRAHGLRDGLRDDSEDEEEHTEDVPDAGDCPALHTLDVERRFWGSLLPPLSQSASDTSALREIVLTYIDDCDKAEDRLQWFLVQREMFFGQAELARRRLLRLLSTDAPLPDEDHELKCLMEEARNMGYLVLTTLRDLMAQRTPHAVVVSAEGTVPSEPSDALVWQWWRDISRLSRVQPFVSNELRRLGLVALDILEGLRVGLNLIRRHRA